MNTPIMSHIDDPISKTLVFKSKLTNGKEVRVLGTYDKPLFIAKDIAKMLGYKDTEQSIQKHVDAEDKISYSDSGDKSRPVDLTGLKIQARTILINESGLYSLILRSKLPSAKEFKRWVTSEVLPSIRKSGEYKMQEYLEQQLKIKDIESRLEIERSWIVKYDRRCVVYIGYIGIIDGKETYKFGWTDDINRRSNDHKRDFGRFDLLFVIECEQNNVLEQKFKEHKEIKKIRFSHIFNTKNKTELIELSSKFTLEDAKTLLKKLKTTLNNQKYIDLKHKERVMELENEKLRLEILKLQEETKQKEIEFKILELKKGEEKKEIEDEIEFEIVESDSEDEQDQEDEQTEKERLKKQKYLEYQREYREANKNKIKRYYDQNKNIILNKMKEKYKCVCGSVLSCVHKTRHEKTKRHIQYTQN